MQFGKSYWKTFEQGIEREWLLTNGIGGFASSTLIGANTRRYHGLLVASLMPPVNRHLVLSKIDESVSIDGRSYNLYSFQTPDYIMKGYHHLSRVVFDPLPAFIYSVEDITLEKKVCMIYGKNTAAITYHIVNGPGKAVLRLTPLVNFRDYHHNSSRSHMAFESARCENGVRVRPCSMNVDIRVRCSDGRFDVMEDCWFYNMFYPVESERGLHPTEDHFIPGSFEIDIGPWEDRYVTVIASVDCDVPDMDGQAIIRAEEKRLEELQERAGYSDDFARRLAAAADNFIVYRKSTDTRTILAGYPWFTDWGRDAMIAFTGLTLCTRRFDEAREILLTFSRHIRHGLVPNVFPDEGQEPAYNSVDASLWYFEAVNKYLKYTGDYEYVHRNLFKSMKCIVESYVKGTLFQIRMDEDCLILAGDENTQLTWMDAKAGDRVFTPRHGKAVEINALWYNALRVMERLAVKFGEDGAYYGNLAETARKSFIEVFWNEDGQCLYDVVNQSLKDDRVRPNQVLAVSLSYNVIEGGYARKVVEKVWRELYTAYGLRSLSPFSQDYRGVYTGDPFARDGAYHQGTVWVWPLGHFISAFARVFGNDGAGRKRLQSFFDPLKDHLRDACVGSISEIFDGNEPLLPRGCFAQAWSVGEILRAYVEDSGCV